MLKRGEEVIARDDPRHRSKRLGLETMGDDFRREGSGFTGAGAKLEAAGIVHRGEFVNRQEVVKQPGARAFLERFNKVGMHALKGYAEGGMVVGAAVARVYGRSTSPTWPVGAAPAARGGGGSDRPIQITQNFPPGTTRATTDQAAAAAGSAVRKAIARTR